MTLFTVLTPTHQRRDTLPRVAASLEQQTCRDFEWIVVDDGSTDGTDTLIAAIAARASFPVRYVRQQHRGKHAAINVAVSMARGELFTIVDSDDELSPVALERLAWHWLAIPAADRPGFAGVSGRCQDGTGALIGNRFSNEVVDSDNIEIRYRYRRRGDRWGCVRTDVMREFPFPEPEGIRYVPESLVWDQIAQAYRTRFVSEMLYTAHSGAPNRLTDRRRRVAQAPGLWLLHRHNLSLAPRWFRDAPLSFLKSGANYGRFSLHLRLGPRALWRAADPGLPRFLAMIMLPASVALWLRDRLRRQSALRPAAGT